MVIDLDACTGCEACVVACQAENNQPLNDARAFNEQRAVEWLRIERYWEGEYPNVKARFIPMLCQHCTDAPCEPVCPVYATYHSPDGLNVQVYNRCIGTRYCANNCPWSVRFFNFWEPSWPDSRAAEKEQRPIADGEVQPACAQSCPSHAITFGDLEDPNSAVSKLAASPRRYQVLGELGTGPAVIYLKRVEPDAPATGG
jgi:molybdopterin-containing oxidoreductase family iron-sulfur binding subunit